VLANAGRDDLVLCQVTSNPYADPLAVTLSPRDFASGSLQRTSYARPGSLFTVSGSLIVREVGTLHSESLRSITERVVELLRTS
jgi:mRNA interferase MazF